MRKLYFVFIVFILAGHSIGFCQTSPATFICNSGSQGTGTIQTFTVPPCVDTITIEAWGAQGGNGGGLGADIKGTFAVTPGEVLNILVGQAGTVNGDGGSGGGGSFVADVTNNAWVVAGGGGGTSGTGSGGDPGLTTTAAGNAGNDGGTGGSAGGGGGGGVDNASCTSGDGGGGFCGNGGGSSNGGAVGAGGVGCVNGGNATGIPLCAGGGFSYLNGGAGGLGCTGGGGCSNNAISGGYGGGGGACGSGGGGGGGYSGGGGGGYSFLNGGEGGGGGSYNNGINQTNTAGVQSGNGQVIITWKASTATATITGSTNVSCNGGSDGTATVTATGGAPYTYSWNPGGQTNQTATGLSAGTYTVIATDALGCTAKDSVTITQPAPLHDSIVSFTNVSVACGSNGTATVGVKGTGPFTYSWNNGQTSSTATNLAAGTYTVIVTNTSGCTTKDSVTITQPPSLTVTVPTTVNDLCNGGNTGSATASVTGGSAPYKYSWNNGETSSKDSLLPAGSYTISVTDANGCTVTATVVINQPPAIRDSVAITVNVLCNGGNTGSATAGVKGGTAPYTYTWSNGEGVAKDSLLAAGTYTLIVKDANGCKDSTNATITQPAVLKLTAAAFAASCNGTCDGSANVIPSGGTGPYKYLWSNGSTSVNANNLCAGNYSVVVTDANGCVHDSTPLTVTAPPAITATINSVSAYCNQSDGSANVTVAGGTPPYTYLWSNGNTTTNATNLKPGTYCVKVKDANNCIDSVCTVVPNTPGETASIATTVNVTCNGGANGSATGSAAGGTAPYTYSWSNAQTTQTATGLVAGTYTLTVTDATGCKDTAVATITEPAPFVITVTGNAQLCIGQKETLTASATGGTSPYTFTWNGTTVGTTYVVNPTVTTNYSVVVTDANGCISNTTVIPVKVRDSLHLNAPPVTPMCQGDTAILSALASGGDSVYSYSWAPGGQTTSTITVSPTSTTTYTVTVTDNCGTPSVSKTIIVNLFPSRPISFTADTLTGCQSVCIKFADSVAGITKTITWNFGDGGTSTVPDPTYCYTSPGVYSVSLTVTNDSGCVVTKSIPNMITVYSNPVAQFTWNPLKPSNLDPTVSFINQSTDSYPITNWAWAFGDATDSVSFKQNPSHTYIDTGWYCPSLVVTDIHGCRDSVSHCIDITPQFTIYIPNAFTPDGNGLNDIFLPKGDYIEGFEMYIFDRWGQSIFHSTDIHNGWNGTVHGNFVQEDTYVYLIYATDPTNVQHTYMGRVTVIR